MKVPTLLLDSVFVAVYSDGVKHEVLNTFVVGCWAMCMHLERDFGIKTSPSTVWLAKKEFIPVKFPYGKTKQDYLAYLNWVINCPKEEKFSFFDDQPNIEQFYKNNPVLDCYIIIKKNN